MKKKHYLKTVEDVLALKNTDTKIYRDGVEGYYQFVKDTLVEFSPYNVEFWRLYPSFDIGDEPYILEEEPMQEAGEADVGKLCLFKSKTEIHYKVSILKKIVHYNGFDMYETEWEQRLGLPTETVRRRLNNGWSVERALTEPLHKEHRRHKNVL